jgi:hypothetical protein
MQIRRLPSNFCSQNSSQHSVLMMPISITPGQGLKFMRSSRTSALTSSITFSTPSLRDQRPSKAPFLTRSAATLSKRLFMKCPLEYCIEFLKFINFMNFIHFCRQTPNKPGVFIRKYYHRVVSVY